MSSTRFRTRLAFKPGGSKRGCVAGLERQREQHSGVERSVVVRIARQNEPMGQGFGINRVQIGHAHRVRRFLGAQQKWLEMAFRTQLSTVRCRSQRSDSRSRATECVVRERCRRWRSIERIKNPRSSGMIAS